MKDYYAVLGVTMSATSEEIKKAYRELVKKWHPDVCHRPDAHDRMIELTEAYGILSNPVTRREYDQHRSESQYTYRPFSPDFEQAQQAARTRAEEYIKTSLSELLYTVLALGVAAVAATAYVGQVAFSGEEGVREQLTLGDKVRIGFKGIFLIFAIILSCTIIAAPVAIPISIMIYKSLTYRGKFIGLAALIEGVAVAGLILVPIMLCLVLMVRQVFISDNNMSGSADYYSSNYSATEQSQALPSDQNDVIDSEVDGSAPPSNVSEYTTFFNERFGFRVDYPSYFKMNPPPTNSDGGSFYDDDGFGMRVYGSYGNGGETIQSEMHLQSEDFDEITYSTIGDNWFVLSGLKGNNILYRKIYVDEGTVYSLCLEYPSEAKTRYGEIVTRISRSFKLLPIDWSN